MLNHNGSKLLYRYFVSCGLELLCAQSFSKNFGLYNDRIGNLTMVMKSKTSIPKIISHMNPIARGMYVNPPCHGAKIVETILTDPELSNEWKIHVKIMADRIIATRTELKDMIASLTPGHDWSHLTTQTGMFCYSGLSKDQCLFLQKERHVYLPLSGRISICGVRNKNIVFSFENVYFRFIQPI